MCETALSRQFGTAALLRFALPNIAMMVFLSLYTIVDGIFISRYVGTLALSAMNMSYPLILVEMAVGIMLASGGSFLQFINRPICLVILDFTVFSLAFTIIRMLKDKAKGKEINEEE